jgi:hypothetical protein
MDKTRLDNLNDYYRQLMNVGFIVLRQAVDSRDRAWAAAEVELLHNVPSLLDEENAERHRYFWFNEREHYLDWVSASGHEQARSRMETFYEPIWRAMEPLLLDFLASADRRKAASVSGE